MVVLEVPSSHFPLTVISADIYLWLCCEVIAGSYDACILKYELQTFTLAAATWKLAVAPVLWVSFQKKYNRRETARLSEFP